MNGSKSTFAIVALLLACPLLGATSNGLPFINDNFPKALTEAKQRQLPVFVEVWAPW